MLRHPEPVGPRDGPSAGRTGIPRAGHHERRLRLVARTRRQPCHARGRPRPPSGDRRCGRCARQRGFRRRLRRRAGVDRVERDPGDGIAGVSIEDSSKDPKEPLFPFCLSVERIQAAREAIDASGTGIVLTGRSEGFIVGRPDLDETLRRLTAYADAGADCLYAPGLRNEDEIRAVVRAVAPKPVNVGVFSDFTTVARLAEIGVRRISVGGALARVAWAAFLEAASEISERGTFAGLKNAVSGSELNAKFP
jgi:2-methylisocitrate lyase-like PEP mutase family enzyme